MENGRYLLGCESSSHYGEFEGPGRDVSEGKTSVATGYSYSLGRVLVWGGRVFAGECDAGTDDEGSINIDDSAGDASEGGLTECLFAGCTGKLQADCRGCG